MTRRRRFPHSQGFTLVEMLMAMTLTSLVIVAALTMLSIDQSVYARQDAMMEASREAQYALEIIERDLLMTGYQVDRNTIADFGPDTVSGTDDDIVGQPQIVHAAPWDLVINTDLDPQVDAIVQGGAGGVLPTGHAPVTFFTGAETVRFTLDSSGDGKVGAADRGDEPEEAVSQNDGLFLLRREVYGHNGTSNTNPSGPIAMVRGPVYYPSGASVQPLFLYWGEFDTDPGLDLWGDSGQGGGVAGNGILETGELAALTAVVDEDLNDNAVLDSGEDRNGNGQLERRITDLIRKVEVHITTETTYPDMRYKDDIRSSAGVPFRYRVTSLNTEIEPRNFGLAGGACGDAPESAGSPSVTNICGHPLADGRVRVSWGLSSDDGANEKDVEEYLVYRADGGMLFGNTPHAGVAAGTSQWDDDWIDARTWPPKQYGYKIRALDCTPQLSESDPIAGPYPVHQGPSYPAGLQVIDVAGDDATELRLDFDASADDPANTTGYGGKVTEYHVYRATTADYRCVPPVNLLPLSAAGAPRYSFVDNATNSTGALSPGELYYYWTRSRDDGNVMSPYSSRTCLRPSTGPTYPLERTARVVNWGSEQPVELGFLPSPDNAAAGYDPLSLRYNIYRSHDTNGDSVPDSLVDHSAGYTAADLAATIPWTGLIWLTGDTNADSIHHSIDGGTTWRKSFVGNPGRPRAASFSDRLNGISVGNAGYIRLTADGGANWVNTIGPISITLRDVVHLDQKTAIVAGNSGTILRTIDGGTTWSQITSGTINNLQGVAGHGKLAIVVGDAGTALRSEDGGATFSPLSFTTQGMQGVCSVDEGGGTFWVGERNELWRSTDGGLNWTPYSLSGAGAIRAVACAPGGWVVAAGTNGRIDLSSDYGASWSSHSISGKAWDATALANGLAWVVDDDGYLHRHVPSVGWTSTKMTSGSALFGVTARPEIAWEDPATIAASSGTSHYYVVTTSYSKGTALDGESGMLADRPGSEESPDDSAPQILVDSCNSIELSIVTP